MKKPDDPKRFVMDQLDQLKSDLSDGPEHQTDIEQKLSPDVAKTSAAVKSAPADQLSLDGLEPGDKGPGEKQPGAQESGK
ncbi:MAG: hypothetical protein ACWA5K_04515 [bacterium]